MLARLPKLNPPKWCVGPTIPSSWSSSSVGVMAKSVPSPPCGCHEVPGARCAIPCRLSGCLPGSVTKRLLARHGSVCSQERLLEERDKTGEHTRIPRCPNAHARPRPCHRVPRLALLAPRDGHV